MGTCLVSNPPYNLKWSPPPFAQLQPRFSGYELPPAANANYAFILTALNWIDDRAALLLPNSIQSTSQAQEAAIRRQLVVDNLIEAVIALPDGMFESTSIPTCVLLLNKHKCTQKTVMVDMRQEYAEEQRDQRGQYGGASHEGRVYHKTVKVLTDAGMEKTLCAIREQRDIPGFSRAVLPDQLKEQGYILTPGRYIESEPIEVKHRSYEEIAADYNRIIRAKNAVKLTVNESLARSLGLYETFQMMQQDYGLADSFAVAGQKVEKESFIQMSKNRAEFRIENKDTERLPEIIQLFLTMWKQRIMMLNNEENRIIAELRDALLPDLMNGNLEVKHEND